MHVTDSDFKIITEVPGSFDTVSLENSTLFCDTFELIGMPLSP